MAYWKVHIAPIKSDGTYEDWRDVSSYSVNKDLSSINRQTENTNYDVGIAPNESMTLSLNNSSGEFSEAGAVTSIFPYRRGGSKVKITYLGANYEPICGIAIAGIDVLGPEINVFEGVLTDKDARQNVSDDVVDLTVLGHTSILEELETDSSSITLSDTAQTALYKLLDRTEFTNSVTLLVGNISPNLNPTLSTINSTLDYFDDTTVKEAVTLLLEATASIMFVQNNVVYVTSRAANSNTPYEFFGQAAKLGIENIQDITEYKNGINRTINLWKWQDTNITSRNTSSITLYGALKKEVNFSAVTEAAYKQTLLDQYKTDFSNPRREMDLTTPINYEILSAALMDKVSIDYPNVPVQIGDGNVPVWNTGSMVWQDEATFDPNQPFFSWPDGLYNVEIESTDQWKIIGIVIDTGKDLMTFKLREIV